MNYYLIRLSRTTDVDDCRFCIGNVRFLHYRK